MLLMRLLPACVCGFVLVLLLRLLARSCPWYLFRRVLLAFVGALFQPMVTVQWCVVVFMLLQWFGVQLVSV
jgi:hypothetical protein